MGEAAQARGARRSLRREPTGRDDAPSLRQHSRRGLGDMESGLSEGQRQRHAAGPCPADHVRGAADIQQRADRELGSGSTSISRSSSCPTTSRRTASVWNVVFDARGHFTEPHTEAEGAARDAAGPQLSRRGSDSHKVEDPTFDVWEAVLSDLGPRHRFGAILFIEKEGFMPLFEAVQLAERYDLAIMSTKGMSVTAGRELVDELCARA